MKAYGDWRQVVLARAERAKQELGAADGRADHVRELLGSVRNTARTPGSLRTWWEGSQQERAWLELHEAEAEIPEILSKDELHVHGEEVLKESKATLGDKDPQVKHLSKLMARPSVLAPHAAMAAEITHLTRAVYDKRDESYAESRTFRNRLIRLTGMSLVGMVLLIVATALGPIDLNPAGGVEIPGGWETPLLIALFGAVGAFVSSIPALSRMRGTRNPFNLPLYQLLLKVTTGPLLAFFGIIMLQSAVITELNPATTLLELLVWAAIFGSTQQVVTRLVDRRANAIVSDTSSS
ncbi:MAG: hypothetical protein ACM3ML_21285 [Micromonosporaceae bacterium]